MKMSLRTVSAGAPATHTRQLPWFALGGQQVVSRLRVAVCGLGGLGSMIVQQLAYLGIRDFVLIEYDTADTM